MREKFKALKERFNSQQGFTLIELMATIAILALIVVIAVPAIGSIMANAQEDSYENSASMIERAAQIAHLDDSTNADGSFTVTELIQAGFLDLELNGADGETGTISYGEYTIDGDHVVTGGSDGNYTYDLAQGQPAGE